MTSCPSTDDLHRFVNEELAASPADEVSRHLESCSRCQTACEQLTAHDAAGLRSASATSSVQLERLIERLASATTSTPNETSLRFPGAPDDAAPLGRLGDYAILERIAEGSQGLLFKARDESLQRQVAIKVLHPQLVASDSARERILREARMGAALDSPNVVQVLHVGQEPNFPPYLVLEYVTGESLRDVLERSRPVAASEAVRILTETARGLAAAHRAGLIHRDIKPSNILIDRTGIARVTDFGLAIDDSAAVRLTQDGVVVGTPAYMSPEQIASPQAIDARSDLYSLGVVFYELLTGEVPFRGTVRMTLLQIAHDDPRSPRSLNESVPRDLETICLKLLQKSPDRRFSNARELIDELGRWSSGHPILSRPVTRRERFIRWCRRNPLVSTLAAASSLLALILIVVLSWSAYRLAQSAQQTRDAADAVARQRNAALETLSKLVFQLQLSFDDDNVDLDFLQRQSLEIAIEGLRNMRLDAAEAPEQALPTAEALRRMAELLSGLEDSGQAELCLEQAASILSGRLKDAPDDPAVLKGMIEILWVQDDMSGDEDDPHDEAKLAEATTLARRLRVHESSVLASRMLADALLREAQAAYSEGRDGTGMLASESRVICESLLPKADDQADELRSIWFDAVDIEYLQMAEAGRDSLAYLRERLNRAGQILPVTDADVSDQVGLLQLIDRMLLELPRGDSADRTAMQQRFDDLVTTIGNMGRSDHYESVIVLQLLEAWTDERLQESNDRSAFRLLQAAITIAELRLEVDATDEFARRKLALYWFNLGSAESVTRGQLQESLVSFDNSVRVSRELQKLDSFDAYDRLLLADGLLSAAESAFELHDENWKSRLTDAEKELQSLSENEVDQSFETVGDLRDRIHELKDAE